LIYFSRARWCQPSRKFTPKLVELFKELDNKAKGKLNIVFISCGEDQDASNEYFKEMPWKALPFSGK
jgi:nucleoredoxin